MTATEDSRPSLDEQVATAAAESVGWRLELVEEAASTNHLVAERFRGGEPHGLVVVAEHQTAGRGRLGRGWVTPARTSVTASFLLVPDDDPGGARRPWSWLPLLTGMAAARAIESVTDLPTVLKWPNDVLVEGGKVGGILLERVGDGRAGAVIGVGLNVDQTAEELPVQEATSLRLATGGRAGRTRLLAALITELARAYDDWHSGAELLTTYRELCSTLGREVRVLVPGGEVEGQAVDVDDDGRLVVRTRDGEEHLAAGDVVHVRAQA